MAGRPSRASGRSPALFRLAALAIALLLASSACAPSASPSTTDATGTAPRPQPAGVNEAEPDANVAAGVAAAWVARAITDARPAVPPGTILVPSLVNVSSQSTIVILGDYSFGRQVLARYDGDSPTRSRLEAVEYPSSITTGLSLWEQARVRSVLAATPQLGASLGSPVTVLDMSWGTCPGLPGACAIVRLSGSARPVPSDAPALAPSAAIRLLDGAVMQMK